MATRSTRKLNPTQKPQAERFLEAAKAAGVTDNSFARAMGKISLQKQARKKMG